MALVIPQGYAHVVQSLRWAGDPDLMAVTYGVAVDGAATAADANDLALELAVAFNTNVMPEISSILETVQTEVTWQLAVPPLPPIIGVSTDTATGGDVEANVIPQNSAYLCHKRSTQGGRGGRGRFYLPGVGETDVDNLGNISAGKITDLNTGLAAFLNDLTAAGVLVIGMAILHDSAGIFAGDVPPQVTSLTVDPQLSTQRRRLRH